MKVSEGKEPIECRELVCSGDVGVPLLVGVSLLVTKNIKKRKKGQVLDL